MDDGGGESKARGMERSDPSDGSPPQDAAGDLSGHARLVGRLNEIVGGGEAGVCEVYKRTSVPPLPPGEGAARTKTQGLRAPLPPGVE